jgi:hypothetical protein
MSVVWMFNAHIGNHKCEKRWSLRPPIRLLWLKWKLSQKSSIPFGQMEILFQLSFTQDPKPKRIKILYDTKVTTKKDEKSWKMPKRNIGQEQFCVGMVQKFEQLASFNDSLFMNDILLITMNFFLFLSFIFRTLW